MSKRHNISYFLYNKMLYMFIEYDILPRKYTFIREKTSVF